MRIPILGGSYRARSPIANIQRCINYYPEKNPKDAPVPLTLYQRPGLRRLVQGNVAPVRGLYRASNGKGYCVIGQLVYSIDGAFNLTQIGILNAVATVPVSMIDNGTTMMLVDSTSAGYQIVLATNAFSQINDPTGAFTGATRIDVLDEFIVFNTPGTVFFGSTHFNSMTFDALYVAGKVGYPDPLVSIFVNRRQIILLGALKSEIWYNAGNPTFPFAEVPGAYIEHGCVAPFSAAQQDIELYWLGQDLQGSGVVFRLRGYDVSRISNHALEYAIEQMIAQGFIISDAVAYTYQQQGHAFYVLNFPSADQTWVYDASYGDPEGAWHQRAWTDTNGVLHRDRTNCHAYLNGLNVVGDWQNGTLYALDQNVFQDQVNPAAPSPMSCIRGFPHWMQGLGPNGQVGLSDGEMMVYGKFTIDLETGTSPLNADGTPPQVYVAWSLDRGRTFGDPVPVSAGGLGQYLSQVQVGPMGAGRDVIFEITHSLNGPAALQGAWALPRIGTN